MHTETPSLFPFSPNDLESKLNDVLATYERDGVVYLKDFLSEKELTGLRADTDNAIRLSEKDLELSWEGKRVYFYSKNPLSAALEKRSEYVTEPYFLSSGDRAHVFYEAIDNVDSVNRIGHGLHLRNEYPSIQNAVYGHSGLKRLLEGAGLKRPICQLSVYIPKHAEEAGSDVRPHQESTFAYTEPQTVQVLWIALEDATIENACMWGILGSNRLPLKYVSRVARIQKTRHFEEVNSVEIHDFDSERDHYTPLEVRAGDAVFFHGNFVHCSPVNSSSKGRPAISFQFIDTLETHYPETNWLQPPNRKYVFDLSAKGTSR